MVAQQIGWRAARPLAQVQEEECAGASGAPRVSSGEVYGGYSCVRHPGKSALMSEGDYARARGAPGVSGSDDCSGDACAQHFGSSAADEFTLTSTILAQVGEPAAAFAELGA